jgi:hypothetical protein
MNRRTACLLLALSTSLFLAGCANEKATAEAKDRKEHPESWVQVYPIGSNIPVWVKRSAAKSTAQETRESQDALHQIQQASNMTPGAGR